jgi:hypothetical protein
MYVSAQTAPGPETTVHSYKHINVPFNEAAPGLYGGMWKRVR